VVTPTNGELAAVAPSSIEWLYDDEAGRQIVRARCDDILPGLRDDSFDIVVTSPPYNMGLTPGGNGKGTYGHRTQKGNRFTNGAYGEHDDAMPQAEYDEWQRWCLGEMWRIARLGVFYNHRPRVEHGRLRVPLGWDYGPADLRQVIIWDRGTGIDVNLRHFCTRQEWVLFFAKPAMELVSHSASGMGDVWRIGPETNKHGHPAPFPVALPARCIAATGARSVLDPFMGVGSTLRAAKDAGIDALGIERNATFCSTAIARLGQGSIFDEPPPTARSDR
jgi:site-specific DNA-methyltransferase (adenine-specific)